MRVGIGYDVHPLVPGRKLVLGGVEIPFNQGLSGHSDADVLTHAIIDALLGAAGFRDIGNQFPSDDPKYKDISSLVLLERSASCLRQKVLELKISMRLLLLSSPNYRLSLRICVVTSVRLWELI